MKSAIFRILKSLPLTVAIGATLVVAYGQTIESKVFAADNGTITEQDNGKVVQVKIGQDVVIMLGSNGDAGYQRRLLSSGGLGPVKHQSLPGRPGVAGDFGSDLYSWPTARLNPGTYAVQILDEQPFGDHETWLFSVAIKLAE